MAGPRARRKRRGDRPAPWAWWVVAAAGAAAVAFACARPPAPRPARPTPSPTREPAASTPVPALVDLEPEAQALRQRVLANLPAGARAEELAAEPRSEGRFRWQHRTVRVALPPGANLKVVTGSLVQAAEDAGGVLVASRPEGGGQVLEFGLEHGGRVLPVLRVRLGPAAGAATARVAVVLDDAGMHLSELERALAVGRPVALAVLPGLPNSEALARRAAAAGLDVLLHLPMEPEDPHQAGRLGPVAVRVSMADGEIAQVVEQALQAVPGAVGVNNHMGSRATQDPRVVRAVLRVVREHGLFFLDSRTTPATSVEEVAREVGVPSLRRAVFLDNDPTPEAVRLQLRRLAEVALREGSAVGIGHANRPHTAEVLAEMVAELEQMGVRFVRLRDLARSSVP